jgi:hypothetical protein
MADLSVGAGATPPQEHTGPLHKAPARRAAEATGKQAKPGISAHTTHATPKAPAEAKPLPEPAPYQARRAVRTAVLMVRMARYDLAALDAVKSPVPPEVANARAEKQLQLKIFEKSAVRMATSYCKARMTSVKAASTALQTAARAKEVAARQFPGVGSRPDKPEVRAYLHARDVAFDAEATFMSTLYDAEEAVKLQKEAEGTPEGDAKAARANFVLAGYQCAAAEIALKAMHDPKPVVTGTFFEANFEAKLIAGKKRDLDVAEMQYRDAASEALRASQAWADAAKRHGSRDDIGKSEAWVKEANDNLNKLPPAFRSVTP